LDIALEVPNVADVWLEKQLRVDLLGHPFRGVTRVIAATDSTTAAGLEEDLKAVSFTPVDLYAISSQKVYVGPY